MDQALFPALQSRLSQLQRRRRDHAAGGGQLCALTERRQVDRRRPAPDLQHREYRLRSLAQAAGVGVFDLDYTDAGDYFSPETRAILGLPEDGGDLSVVETMELVHPEDRGRVAAKLEASLDPRGDGLFDDEHRLLLPDGTIRWVRVRGRTFFAEDGERRPLGTTGIMVDVTSRKEMEEALRRESSRLQSILDNAPVLISIKDLEGRMVLANRAVFDTVAVPPPEEFFGRSVFDLFPLEVAEKLSDSDRKALESDGPIRVEEPVRHRDGSEHTYLTVKFPVRDVHSGKTRSLCAISLDITERKAAEAKVRGLNVELEQRVKKRTTELQRANDALLRSNLELRHFAHAAAHDLQTPLRSIAGFAQLLQQEVKGLADSRGNEWAGLVVDNAKRLQTLIQELLAYTRLDVQGLPFEAVDLQKLLSEVLSSLAGLIRDTGAEVTGESLPTALVDRTQIAQLFQNLVENGVKYNRSRPPRVTITCRRQGGEWLFSVGDNGIGIDRRHHERIFEIFRRLHSYSQVPGTGIGLALCRRIVERHGGRIWVESEPGEGSIFHFTLPIRTRLG
ncbi:MAG: sensor histidine kinase [Actinomycetota bacterium]